MASTFKIAVGTVQLSAALATLTVGGVWSATTLAVAVLSQPLAEVTLTVYSPATPTEGLAWLEENPTGPDQA